MKTKQINTGLSDILLVELPDSNGITESPVILKTDEGEPYLRISFSDFTCLREIIPDGNWSILSRADEVTEEQAEPLVDKPHFAETFSAKLGPSYTDYTNRGRSMMSAKYSLDTLLEANDVYWWNPLGKERPTGRNTLDLVPFEYAKESLKNAKERWDNYQQNVWDKSRTYILIKK